MAEFLKFLLTRIYALSNFLSKMSVKLDDENLLVKKNKTKIETNNRGAAMCALPNVEQQTINRVAMPKNNVMRLIRGEVFIGPKQRIFIEPDDEIVTGATLNIGKVLKLSDPELALILGVKESDLPDLRAGKTGLKIVDPSRNAFECAKLLGKIYLYLDYIINGDRDAACSWLRNLNTKLDGIPIDIMKTKPGLEHVESYLDSIQSKI